MLCLILAGFLLSAGDAAAAGPAKRPAHAPAAPHGPPALLGSEAVLRALALVGVPYRWGGSLPATGLDCSGLVHHVFGQIGVDTPRDTRGQSRAGTAVRRRNLQPGDLVFFNTLRRAYSHVGIYLGDGRFVHAPSAGSEVRIESMDLAYWRQRYNGARRIDPAGATQMATAATPTAGPPPDAALPRPAAATLAVDMRDTSSYYLY